MASMFTGSRSLMNWVRARIFSATVLLSGGSWVESTPLCSISLRSPSTLIWMTSLAERLASRRA